MKEKLKIVVIGCGRFSQFFVPLFKAHPVTEKVYVCDLKKDREEEFVVRFMLVMMLDYYLESKYINDIFDIIDNIKCDKYYVKMAIAWLLSVSIVKCEKETLEYLNRCNLDKFTFNKVVSKCSDSYRVRDDLKKILKCMKRYCGVGRFHFFYMF